MPSAWFEPANPGIGKPHTNAFDQIDTGICLYSVCLYIIFCECYIKGPTRGKTLQFNCVKNCKKNWTECSLAQHRFPIRYVSFLVSCVCLLEMMPSWCRQVNWGICGIPWVNWAVLCMIDDWKGQFWDLRYCRSKLRSLICFSVRYDIKQ
jgi:hypothetical protein